MIQLIAESKAFHSAISKMKFGIQDAISSFFFYKIKISRMLDFEHSLDVEMRLEEEEIKRFKD